MIRSSATELQAPPSLTATSFEPNSKLKRVLHIVNGEHFAGAERVQDLLALNLPQHGYEAGFVCIKAKEFVHQRKNISDLCAIDFRFPFSRSAVNKIASIAQSEGYSAIHSHTMRSSWAAIEVGRVTGLPTVHTMHDMFFANNSPIHRWLLNRFTISRLRQADVVTTVSPQTQRLAERLRLGKTRTMILNGVPDAEVGFTRSRPEQEWTIGTVGLLRPGKGIEVLLKALAHLRGSVPAARLIVVGSFGDPGYENEIRGLVDSLSLSDDVKFVGFQSDVASFLRAFDLFVMPSTAPEGLPMVLLEAMAHGLPTIGSAVPGVEDVLSSGGGGTLFPAGDEKALAERLEDFTQGREDYLEMSQTATSRHRKEFSVSRMAQEFAAVYDGLGN